MGAIGGATGGVAGAAAANVATNAVSGKAAREGTDSERRGESPSKHKFNGEFNLHQMKKKYDAVSVTYEYRIIPN